VTIGICVVFEISKFFYAGLLFAGMLSFFCNIHYLLFVIKKRLVAGGGSVAHAGFALLLAGALISTSKSVVISRNTSGMDVSRLGKDFNNAENILLRSDDTLQMGEYYVTYAGKKQEGVNHYFEVRYFTKEGRNYRPAFTLHPVVQTNPRMGNAAEPDTRHFWNRDVYTHITYADMSTLTQEDTTGYPVKNEHEIATGDTVFTSTCMLVLDGLSKDIYKKELGLSDEDLAVGAKIRIIQMSQKQTTVVPVFGVRGNTTFVIPVEAKAEGMKFEFTSLNPENGKIKLTVLEKQNRKNDFIVMKAIIFPMINLLWTGCIVMVIGTCMAIAARIRKA